MEYEAEIRQMAARGRLGHAWLITGADPKERAALTDFLAETLLCEAESGQPCGSCRHCRKVRKGLHPDLTAVRRREDRKELGVEQIRELRREANLLPNEAARRVFLIEEAESMNASAQNALLKVLEEPPAGAAFILSGDRPGAFLPTVRSRCVSFDLHGTPAVKESERAELLTEACVSADPAAWFAQAIPLEKLDKERFDRLLTELRAAAAETAVRESDADRRARALAFCRDLDTAAEMRRSNVSAGHCLGWLGSRIG